MVVALLVKPTTEDNTNYYVSPDPLSNRKCTYDQSCTINFKDFALGSHNQENVTLIFQKGFHSLSKLDTTWSKSYKIANQNLTMVGLHTGVNIHGIDFYFYDTFEFQIKNLTLSNGYFHIAMPQGATQLSLFSVTLIDFILFIEDATLAQLNDCVFTSGVNTLTIHKSKVMLSGNSTFFNNHNSAFVSYNSDITLSGTVSFVNNTGIRGGAMALYSSIIYLTSGLNIRFINNTAHETGGAIHIEPDMTRASCPKCFYRIQGQDTDIAIYYSKNRAELGGDNIYGTSLALCDNCLKQSHNITSHFLPNVSMSSVSSDPTQVCLCDNDGQPQCENTCQILTSKSVHPGETISISAVIVGGDYGTTIGTVHASFRSTNYSLVPVLKYSHRYSQWINDISACTNLQYTIYSRHIGMNFTMYLTVHFSNNNDTIDKNNASCDSKITAMILELLHILNSQYGHVQWDLVF